MIPLRDRNKPNKLPILTMLITGINTAIFIYMLILGREQLGEFISTYGLFPENILQGQHLYSILTGMFLHASFGHLFSNMLFLNIFGGSLEEKLGKISYLLLYIISGITGILLQTFISRRPDIPVIGASAAIAGLMGAFIVYFPSHRIDILLFLGIVIRIVTVPAIMLLIFWIGFQFLSGIGSFGFAEGGVAYFAHIGGFLFGLITAVVNKIRNNN